MVVPSFITSFSIGMTSVFGRAIAFRGFLFRFGYPVQIKVVLNRCYSSPLLIEEKKQWGQE